MKLSMRTGALVAGLAMAIGVTVPLALPAGAALTSHVTCASVTSGKLTPAGAKSTFAKCTPATLKGGTGTTTKTPPPGTKKGQVGFKVTWSGGKGSTTAAIAFTTQKTRGKCPAGYARSGGEGHGQGRDRRREGDHEGRRTRHGVAVRADVGGERRQVDARAGYEVQALDSNTE